MTGRLRRPPGAGPKDFFGWRTGAEVGNLCNRQDNAAVSRARGQLWGMHSRDPKNHINEGDLRRRLIERARAPNALICGTELQAARTEARLRSWCWNDS